MQAIILAVGDELVLGQTIDTNSAYLSDKLSRLGITTAYHQTVEDDLDLIARVIRQASTQADLLIISGGLGPTQDDLTRHALASAMDAPLQTDPDSLRAIEAFFADRGRPMPPTNRIQAQHPRGSSIIPNPVGTAPGIKAKLNLATIYVVPGVPGEMRYIYEQTIEPQVRQLLRQPGSAGKTILTSTIHSFGAGESTIAQLLSHLMDRAANPKVGTTVANGICSVRIRAEFDDADQARAQLQNTIKQVENKLGPIVFGRDEQTLAHTVIALLKEKSQTIATAESCTGGMIGSMLTDVPGASSVYQGGWVSYANAFKQSELDVPPQIIEQHGAVSQSVAIAMARGALARSGADLAIATTGIAGPDGGSDEKPVGTLWVALAQKVATGVVSKATLFLLLGSRNAIRDRAAKSALQMLRLHLLGLGPHCMQWAQPGDNLPATAQQ